MSRRSPSEEISRGCNKLTSKFLRSCPPSRKEKSSTIRQCRGKSASPIFTRFSRELSLSTYLSLAIRHTTNRSVHVAASLVNRKNYIAFRYSEHFILRNVIQSAGHIPQILSGTCASLESARCVFLCHECVESETTRGDIFLVRGPAGLLDDEEESHALVWLADHDVCFGFPW